MTEIPNITPWTAVVAVYTFISPNILAIIQQPHWPLWLRKVVMALFHLVTAAVYLGGAGKLDGVNLTVAFSLILTYGAASYTSFWKPLADNIEIKTASRKSLRKLGISRVPLTATSRPKDVMENSLT